MAARDTAIHHARLTMRKKYSARRDLTEGTNPSGKINGPEVRGGGGGTCATEEGFGYSVISIENPRPYDRKAIAATESYSKHL